jgi:hypothetical protein
LKSGIELVTATLGSNTRSEIEFLLKSCNEQALKEIRKALLPGLHTGIELLFSLGITPASVDGRDAQSFVKTLRMLPFIMEHHCRSQRWISEQIR